MMLRALQSKTRSTAARLAQKRSLLPFQPRIHPSTPRFNINTLLMMRGLTTGSDDSKDESNKKQNNKKKFNFDRRILQPAQQGHLTGKHDSGIPHLAARKSKAHLKPVAGRAGRRGPPPDNLLGDKNPGDDDNDDRQLAVYGGAAGSGEQRRSKQEEFDESLKYVMEDYDPYFAFELFDDKKYYWREEEFENLVDDVDESIFFGPDGDEVFEVPFNKKSMEPRPLWDPENAYLLEEVAREANAKGSGKTPLPSDVPSLLEGDDEDQEEGQTQQRARRSPRYDGQDPEEWFFSGCHDILEAPGRTDLPDEVDSFGPPPELRKEIVELAPHGTGVEGFIQAMQEHPTEIARVTYRKRHPAGIREPKPDFPKNRQPHPPLEFIEEHNRFIYVTGLPPLVINGEDGDLDNPVHRSLLEKTVARLAGVDSTQVWPVNRTSAFVGFFTPRAMADALHAGPSEKVLSLLPTVKLLSDSEGTDNPFEDTEPERVVQLTQIPAGHTPSSLLRTLFPPDSEVGTIFGTLLDASKDVHFISSTKVLLRFSSAEHASGLLSSTFWNKRLADVGLYPVRYFRARRELVHGGWTGPIKDDEVRLMGPRLIVDGDMPSKEFYVSHPRCLHVRNLDPITHTPEMLTELFQPYSELPRQVGSIEIVKCEAGIPTDRAYIGFDHPGEAEACIKACKGSMKIGDRRLTLRLVNDRIVPGQKLFRAEKRPERSVEELWDDLNNWEKYVNPADIEYLEQNGVSKVIVDEALRRIRRKNPTFGPLDQCVRSEAIEPDKKPGELYKDIVQLYVQSLKECVATPDNVGVSWEVLHMPDEPIDVSIFDDWERKKAEIEKSRARQ